MSSADLCLPHLTSKTLNDDDDLKLDDENHISEDSGACDHLLNTSGSPSDASKTIESNDCSKKENKDEQEG